MQKSGLLQLISKGAQDYYLTGNPEITFFNTVYRRHTPFATDIVEVAFDDCVAFGSVGNITVPRFGDLLANAYLQIKLPEIDLKRILPIDQGNSNLTTAQFNYDIVTKFASVNRRAYENAFDIFQAENITDSLEIIQSVISVFEEASSITVVNDFKVLLQNETRKKFYFDQISMSSIVSRFVGSDPKQETIDAMINGIRKTQQVQDYYFGVLRDAKLFFQDANNDNIQFAWVKRIGYALVEYIEVSIGGQRIDKQYGDYMNIWFELSCPESKKKLHDKLIGDIEILTTLDRTIKPEYTLRIPLQFWFCRFYGWAIPLIALQYHDVRFSVKFRKLEEVSYVESDTMIILDNGEEIFLNEVVKNTELNIESTILLKYVQLDSLERNRFAGSSHEYLIEQTQLLEIPDITRKKHRCIVNFFVHPVKEMLWVAQKKSYIENDDGYTNSQWFNYSETDEKTGNLIKTCSINFSSREIVPEMSGNYYNYLQPYKYHHTTPSDGVNVYSFALFPEELQPSGAANFDAINHISLNIEFADSLLTSSENIDPVDLRIYVRNINVLKIVSGMAALRFV